MTSASFEDSPAPVKSKPSQIPPDSFFAGGYFRDSEVGHRPVQNHPPQLPNCSPGTGPRDKKRVPLSDPVPHFLFLFTSPYSLFPRGRFPSPGDIPAVLCSVVRMPAGPVPAAGLAPAAVAPRPGAGSRPAPRLPRPLLRRPDRRRRFPLRSPLARPPRPRRRVSPRLGLWPAWVPRLAAAEETEVLLGHSRSGPPPRCGNHTHPTSVDPASALLPGIHNAVEPRLPEK